LPTPLRCRSLRLVMFTFFCVSATVGAVIATTQVFGALRGAEDALPLNDVATVSLPGLRTVWAAVPAH
jgi:Low psii accumulation1 / Rep27